MRIRPNSENYMSPRREFDQLKKEKIPLTPVSPNWSFDTDDAMAIRTTGNGIYYITGALRGPNSTVVANEVVAHIPVEFAPLGTKLFPGTQLPFGQMVAIPTTMRISPLGQIILSLETTQPDITLYCNGTYFRG
jgi:hypothetical protein